MVFLCVLGVLVLQAVYFLLVWQFGASWERYGQFGDLFGGFNAASTGVGFVAVAWTLILQSQQNLAAAEAAKEDAEAQRKAIEALNQQVRALNQAVESQNATRIVMAKATRLNALVAAVEDCNRRLERAETSRESLASPLQAELKRKRDEWSQRVEQELNQLDEALRGL
jgi:hypothetical protein